jgi:hypothetical protein
MIQLVSVDSIPLLPTGKVDYRSIAEMAPAGDVPMRRELTLGDAVKIVASRQFLGRVVREAAVILGLAKPDWPDVRTIFKIITGASDVRDDSCFSDLGDSLSYVQTGIAIEDYLGFLPENWNALTVEQLEALRTDPALI